MDPSVEQTTEQVVEPLSAASLQKVIRENPALRARLAQAAGNLQQVLEDCQLFLQAADEDIRNTSQAPRAQAGNVALSQRERMDLVRKTSAHPMDPVHPYVDPVIGNDHRFHGKNKEEVKQIFSGQLGQFLNLKDFSSPTCNDTVRMCVTFWERFKLDMTESNDLTKLFWPFPLAGPPVNAGLKSLQKVINTYEADRTKFQGIINKLQKEYDERNSAIGPTPKFLSSGDVDRLFFAPTPLTKWTDTAHKLLGNGNEMLKIFDNLKINVAEDLPNQNDDDLMDVDAEGETDEESLFV